MMEYYLDKIRKLKTINDKIEFTSDFIIGYPGETNEDFNQSLDLLKMSSFILSADLLS